MGTPVKMACNLTETDHKLSGTCSGAADNFTPHKLTGKVKARTLEWEFQTYVQGNPISLIVNGTLSDDGSKMNGDLDVEPMGVGGQFTAKRYVEDATGTGAATPAVTPAPAPIASAAVAGPAGETWKVDGNVQGTQVTMTCLLSEAEHKLTGTCTGAGEDMTPRPLSGEVTAKGLTWRFDSQYEGNPITVSMSATKNEDGTKMSGTMAVSPMGVDGTFVAVKR